MMAINGEHEARGREERWQLDYQAALESVDTCCCLLRTTNRVLIPRVSISMPLGSRRDQLEIFVRQCEALCAEYGLVFTWQIQGGLLTLIIERTSLEDGGAEDGL